MASYDGSYFRKGNVYFRYSDEKRGWFSFSGLHTLLERYVAEKAKTPNEVTKVVSAHYYDGRMTTNVAKSDQLERERDFELSLISAGVVPHYLPLKEKEKPSPPGEDVRYELAQKGVDVHIAIDALDFAHANRYDVAVLITGDEDFVPLVRRITSIGKQTLLAHFRIEPWKDSNGNQHKGTFTSGALIDAVTYSLNFNSLVREPDWKTEVKSLFFMPKGEAAGKQA
jgi:uncharacterized LabA/DUF88 family protein